jgi:glutamine phosphoribosylpyrophosphate amidotransferase
VAWPCFFGIDFASRAELMAGSLAIEEIRQSIGADSLGFVSLDGLIASTTLPATRLCRACFDGDYPIAVADGEKGKHLLESVVGAVSPTAGVAAGSAARLAVGSAASAGAGGRPERS